MDEVETPQAGTVTVAQLDELVERMQKLKEEIAEASKLPTKLNKELSAMEAQAALFLKELERDNYQTPYGTMYMRRVWSVTLPKTDEDKAALFGWLRERGIFERYATVNSISLNALYRAERKVAEEEGTLMEFSLPGVGKESLMESVVITKGKKG